MDREALVERVYAVAAQAGLFGDSWRNTFFAGFPAEAVASIPTVRIPLLQLHADLRWCAENQLADGRRPLNLWLKNAAARRKATVDGLEFARILADLERGGATRGRGGPLPEGLDRGPQWMKCRPLLGETAREVRIVLVPHESDQDAPKALVVRARQRVESALAGDTKGAVREPASFGLSDYVYDDESLRFGFKEKIAEKFGILEDGGTAAELFGEQLDHYSHVFVEMSMPAEDLGDRLTPFLAWLDEFWRGFHPKAKVILFGHLSHSKMSAAWVDQLRVGIESQGAQLITVLPPLDKEIQHRDVKAWFDDAGFKESDAAAAHVLKGADSPRMAPVIRKLVEWLNA